MTRFEATQIIRIEHKRVHSPGHFICMLMNVGLTNQTKLIVCFKIGQGHTEQVYVKVLWNFIYA